MNVVVIGTGYVGLVQGACLAHLGHNVVCVDIDDDRVAKLNRAEIPIHEPGLPELVAEGRESGRLQFTTDVKEAVSVKPAVVFVCVQTPRNEDGSCDLSYIRQVLETWGPLLNPSSLVVIKSTVPPGTRRQFHEWLGSAGIQIASNPEFLRQGTSIQDFLHPHRVVLGVESKAAEEVLRHLYQDINAPVVVTTVEGAQLSKYAANTMLASRLSLINEIANIAEAVGADIKAIEDILGHDSRIGKAFLRSGAGFGGSCFPKDVLALDYAAQQHGYKPRLIEPIISVNNDQPKRFVANVQKRLGDLRGKKLAVWGLAFNKGTDDVRESPALAIVQALVDLGAEVVAYDPQAMANARKHLPLRVTFVTDKHLALSGAGALLVLTEWPEFQDAKWTHVHEQLLEPIIFDAKHFLPHADLRAHGFEVIGIGLWPGGGRDD